MLDTLDEYMEELNLMKKQYGQEEELYPLINIMLRKWGNLEGCSIRAVDNGKKAKDIPGRVYLGGYCAFPDISILDKKFDATKNVLKKDEIENGIYENPLDYIYGCVEAKKFWEDLLTIDEGKGKLEILVSSDKNDASANTTACFWVKIGDKKISPYKNAKAVKELIGELLWYGKVLYTNGIVWKEISISKIMDEDKARNVSVIKLREKIKEKFDELLNKKIKMNEINILEVVESFKLSIYVECKNIATLFSYIEHKGCPQYDDLDENQKKNSEAEWIKLIRHLVNMSWKPTTQETGSKNNTDTTEATKPAVENQNALV